MYVVTNKGELVNEYSKVHLFQLMDEHKYLIAEIVLVNLS